MSDYFVWETRRRSSEALICEFPPTQQDYGVSFFIGRRFLVDLPELEVVIDRDGLGVLTDDLVVRKQRCVAHSTRLHSVLRRVGVDNIDYYPLRIVNPIAGEVYRSHEAANILDVIHCIDREKSDLDIDDEDPSHLWYINRLVLLRERLGDAVLFRLGERPTTVIVRLDVKEAVERAGITGALFLPVEGYREYHGFAFNNPRNVIGTHDDDPDGPADGIKRNVRHGGESPNDAERASE
jgi:hypothetical protein